VLLVASGERVALQGSAHGYYSGVAPCGPGAGYRYVVDGAAELADPASRWQPDGVHGPSEVVDLAAHQWDDGGYRAVPLRDAVLYELHIGTFTAGGTFASAVAELDDLVQLGVTAVEIMPVAQFPGSRNWGYDGVFPFAVQHTYGGPAGLQALVEECHRRGLGVVLDVVYNHLGPEGNVLPAYGPYLTDRYRTPWGPAVNLDGPDSDPVRDYFIANAVGWLRDFHVDALRLDAVHELVDHSARPFLSELAGAVHDLSERSGRPHWLIAESADNNPLVVMPGSSGGLGLDGQWNDDFHHAAHVVLTGERAGYYADFQGPADLAKAYERVFVNDGGFSAFFGRRHGGPATQFSGDRFVAFIQNHDQVGNRLRGDRLAACLPASALRLAAGLLLLSARLPLLFMGEEYGETRPFPFFCDFEDQALAEAVRRGRKAEFAAFGWLEEPPDPVAQATSDSAVLSWTWQDPQRSGLRRLYRDLLRLRRSCSALRCFAHGHTRLPGNPETPAVLELSRGGVAPGERALTILFNLTSQEQPLPADTASAEPTFRSEVEQYGGPGDDADLVYPRLRPHEFALFGPLGD
jgi:maltooligosyltrehalose trehalohydrolase